MVICGGYESMSNVPFFLPNMRRGIKFGNGQVVDALIHDGLLDPYSRLLMGQCSEKTAKEMGVSREVQDEYCLRSYQAHQEAWDRGYL